MLKSVKVPDSLGGVGDFHYLCAMKQDSISQELMELVGPMVEADLWDPFHPDEAHIVDEDDVAVFLDRYCLYRGDESGLVDWLEYMLTEEYDRRVGMYECSVREMDDFIRNAIASTVFSPSHTMFRLDTLFTTGADVLTTASTMSSGLVSGW